MLFKIQVRLDISSWRGGWGQIGGFSRPEFDSISQVDVPRTIDSVSPLSLWERARVRGF
jgi:hypothetical protein